MKAGETPLAIRATFALLIAIGIGASVLRLVFPTDVITRFEPVRTAVHQAVGLTEPDPLRRAEAVADLDRKFATHWLATRLHVVSGGVLLLLIPFQFSRSMRARHRSVHRWTGRVALAAAWVSGLGGLYFGVLHPFAGAFERVTVGVVGIFFLAAVTLAFTRIRQGRVAAHREWMIRGMAAALAIATVRLVAIPIDLFLTSRGLSPETIFAVSLWAGWGTTLAGAEWLVRRTRVPVA